MCRESAICLISGDEDPKADHPGGVVGNKARPPISGGPIIKLGDSLSGEKKQNCNGLFFSRLLHANLGLDM